MAKNEWDVVSVTDVDPWSVVSVDDAQPTEYIPSKTGMRKSGVFDPRFLAVEDEPRSVLEGKRVGPSSNDLLLNPDYVDSVRDSFASIPEKDRLAALRQVAEYDKTVRGRAAKALLEQAEYNNAKITPEAKKEALELNKAPKVTPTGGKKQKPKEVSFLDSTPNILQSIDGVTAQEVVDANETAMGLGEARDKARIDSLKPIPVKLEESDKSAYQRLLDLTVNTSPGVGGFALESAGDVLRGLSQGVMDFSSSAWGAAWAAANAVGAGDTAVGKFARDAAMYGKAKVDSYSNPNDPNSISQNVARSIVGSLASAGLTGGFGNASLALMSGVSAGNAYAEAKAAGRTDGQAAERAAVNFFAEFVGEKVALPALQKLIKSAGTSGATMREIAEMTGEFMARDGIGEQFTTAVESFYDKFGSGGTQPNMTWADYTENALQTFKSTFVQGLVMGGGSAGINRLIKPPTPESVLADTLNNTEFTKDGVQESVDFVNMNAGQRVPETTFGMAALAEERAKLEQLRATTTKTPEQIAATVASPDIQTFDQAIATAQAAVNQSHVTTAATAAINQIDTDVATLTQNAPTAPIPGLVDPLAQGSPAPITEPVRTWTGRKGGGYDTADDAATGLARVSKDDPSLDWKVEQMPDGRFRVAGYAPKTGENGNVTGENGNLPPVMPARVTPTPDNNTLMDFVSGQINETAPTDPRLTPLSKRPTVAYTGVLGGQDAATPAPRVQNQPDAQNPAGGIGRVGSEFESVVNAGATALSAAEAPTVSDVRDGIRSTQSLKVATGITGLAYAGGWGVSDPQAGSDAGGQREAQLSVKLAAQVAKSAFGVSPVPVKGLGHLGVAYQGKAFVDVDEVIKFAEQEGKNPAAVLAIQTVGHETTHVMEKSADPEDQQAYRNFRAVVLRHAKPGVLELRGKIEGADAASELAASELTADVSGNFWFDHKFWGDIYDIDNGSTFRRVVYRFMQAATKFIGAAKGFRFNNKALVSNVDEVRKAAAKMWAQKAMGQKPPAEIADQVAQFSQGVEAPAGVIAEVAPNPDQPVANDWREMTIEERTQATRAVANKVVPRVFSELGLKGWTHRISTGTYEHETNPNVIIDAPKDSTHEEIDEVAKALGHALDQKAMVTFDEGDTNPETANGFVKVVIPAGMSTEQVNSLRNWIADNAPQVDGDTLRDGALIFGNFTHFGDNPLSDDEYRAGIRQAVESFDWNGAEIRISQPERYFSGYIQPETRDGYLEGTRYGEGGGLQTGPGERGDDVRGRQGRGDVERLRQIGQEAIALRDRWIAARASARRGPVAAEGASRPEREYGAPRDRAVSAVGVHFSQQRRPVLSSTYFGTGHKGSEQARLADAKDIAPRIYFYVDNGNGVHPEAGVGGVRHTVKLNNLYSTKLDPLGLVKGMKSTPEGRSDFERSVVKSGFDGYLADNLGGQQDFAVLLGKHEIEMPRYSVTQDGNWQMDEIDDLTDEPVSFRDQSKRLGDYEKTDYFANGELITGPGLPAFMRDNKLVDDNGNPLVWYHGTARDVESFTPKQADAVFLSPKPEFAESFADASQEWMALNYREVLSEDQIERVKERAIKKVMADKTVKKSLREQTAAQIRSGVLGGESADAFYAEVRNEMPTGPNIMPLIARATNPFDYRNEQHVIDLIYTLKDRQGRDFVEVTPVGQETFEVSDDDLEMAISSGIWNYIEAPEVQDVIRNELGHDAFYVKEGGVKNLAIYDPKAVKSLIGNSGQYNLEDARINFSKNQDAAKSKREIAREPIPLSTFSSAPYNRLAIKIFDEGAGKSPGVRMVDSVGVFFDARAGGEKDFTAKANRDEAIRQAVSEVRHMLTKEKSGKDWYEEDVARSFSETEKHIPSLKSERKRRLFSVVAGIMSAGSNAQENWFIAANNFKHYENTGVISGRNPENGKLWHGGTTSVNKAKHLGMLDTMVRDLGESQAVDWLYGLHTVSEINDARLRWGNMGTGVSGKADSLALGLKMFGEKIGPFVMNINGIHDVTVDVWMTRTFNRWFGRMIGPDGKMREAPTEPERRVIKSMVESIAVRTELKPYQVQSVLWFFEQGVFRSLGTNAESYNFSDGARKFAERETGQGNAGDGTGRQNVRVDDGAEAEGGRQVGINLSRTQDTTDQYLSQRNRGLTTVTPQSTLNSGIDLAVRSLESAVEEIKSGNYRQASVPIGPVPHTLRMLGHPTQMLKADASIIKKVLIDKHSDDFKDVSPREFVMGIYRPALVLKGERAGEFELVTPLTTEDGPVMVSVKADTQNAPDAPKVAAIMSAYAKPVVGKGNTIGSRVLAGRMIYADMLTAPVAISGNSEALTKGSTTGGLNSAILPQGPASPKSVPQGSTDGKPLNKNFTGWKTFSTKILSDIANKKIKTDVDLVGWIGKHYKGDANDAPAFSKPQDVTETPEFKRWSNGASVVALGNGYAFKSGEPVVVAALHGTTFPDIYSFDRSKGDVESDFGAGFYASNTPEDVALNYANEVGTDLTMKVESLAERIESDDEFEGDHGDAIRAARAKLSGAAPNTMKLYMRFDNPVVIGGKNETVLDYEENFDEEAEEYDEPTGKLVEFVEAVREIAPDYYASTKEIDSAVARIFEESEGEGLLASSAIRIIKNDLIDAYTEDGLMAGSEIARRALESIGFDGIIDTSVSKKFRMDGMDKNTVHFIAFYPTQIKSATGNSGAFDPTNPDIRYSRAQPRKGIKYMLPGETRLSKTRRLLQDYFLPVLEVQKALLSQGGTVTEASDVYRAEERMYGRIEEALRDFRKRWFDPMIQKTLEKGLTMDEVSLYAYAKHAKERNGHIATIRDDMPDNGSGMTNQEADAILKQFEAEGKTSDLEDIHGDLMATTAATRRVMLDEGLITQDQYDAWENQFESYVPLRGFENADPDGEPVPFRNGGRGFNIRGKETMRALGRRTRATDIVENIAMDYERAVDRGERNQVAKSFLEMIRTNPDPSLWEINKRLTKESFDRYRGKVVKRTQIDAGADTIAVKIDGKEVYITIKDQRLLNAMRRASKSETGQIEAFINQTSGRFLSLIRKSLTQYNPVFSAVNAVRDFQTGSVGVLDTLGMKGVGLYAKHYRAAVAAAGRHQSGSLGKSGMFFGDPAMDRYFEEFRAAGGTTGGFYGKSAEDMNREIRNILLASGAKPKGLSENIRTLGGTKTGRAILRGAQSAGNVLEFTGAVSENAARVAAYRAARELGKTPAEAASIAKNLTTNFNRKGEWGAVLNGLFLFYNASVQGAHRAAVSMRNPKVLGLTAGLAALGATTALLALSMGGDDDDDGQAYWDKIPQFEKERNLIIMLPPGYEMDGVDKVGTNGRYIKIPMPYVYNIFPNFGMTMVDVIRNQKDKTQGVSVAKGAVNMLNSVMGSLNPLGGSVDLNSGASILQAVFPTVADIAVQQVMGVDSFNRPTAPYKGEFDLDPDSENVNARQAGGAWHMIARGLNRVTGGDQYEPGLIDVTPGTLENVAKQLTGGTGTFLSDLFVNLPTKLYGVYVANNEADITYRDYPFLRNFYGEVDGVTDSFLMYERRRDVMKAKEVQNNRRDAGVDQKDDPKEDALASLGKMSAKYTKQMSALKREEISLAEDAEMTTLEKNIRRKEIKARRSEIAREYNRIFMDVMRDAQ